ncbi:MAG TPA: formate dehydrogenase accessory protein FdhE [Desulfosporosinus sp.]|nr:formate dehydrogenase accessory protein FdhE [Desulfosporosinus sp.]
MDKIMHKVSILGGTTLEQAYKTYSLLNEEVRRWQDERGSFWMEESNPAETSPYYPIVDFPEMVVLELWKRLNQVIGILISESVLREMWIKFKASQPVSDSELLSCLQIALSGIAHLSRVRMLATKKDMLDAARLESDESESTMCPICGEVAMLSVLAPPTGKRLLHCTLCGHEWPTKRIACIRCGREEASEQNYLHSEEFLGVEVVACETCGQYFKEFDLRVSSVEDFVWEDVRTLPLNYAAEQWLAERAKISRKIQ